MFTGFSHTHSLIRYIIVILFIIALVQLWRGYFKNAEWTRGNSKVINYLTIAFDVQIVIGLVLYLFLSPLVQAAFNDFGSAMKDSLFRFFAVEHITVMLISLTLVHIGKVKISKAETSREKFKKGTIYFTIAFILLFFGIPWPFYSFGMNWF